MWDLWFSVINLMGSGTFGDEMEIISLAGMGGGEVGLLRKRFDMLGVTVRSTKMTIFRPLAASFRGCLICMARYSCSKPSVHL